MINQVPRNLDEDYSFNVNIKKHLVHKSSYLSGQIKKSLVKKWLDFMISTPLYKHFNITYNRESLQSNKGSDSPSDELVDENIEIETIEANNEQELLLGVQQTLLWNKSTYLDIAPGQNKIPLSVIYDSYAEELFFPAIYYGQPRTFKSGVRTTPFSISTSEIRRRDRRGVTPQHILYMA